MTLRERIAAEIRDRGPIPFSRYMELCLYEPGLGYYSRFTEQFGKAGDFYTSSDVHAVFGRLLARQFEEMWRVLGAPASIEILELGPGRGLFARDLLDWSEKKFPDFFAALHYALFEQSAALREKLGITLERHIGKGKVAFAQDGAMGNCASSKAPDQSAVARALAPDIPVIVFANEFFDALPVEVLSAQGSLRVDWREGRFVETWVPASPEENEFLDRFAVHPEAGEQVEAPLISQQYMSSVSKLIRTGFFVIVDYGYTRHELLAGRHRGTVTAYRQHSVSANPYEAPGEQDITAHVNFTALAAAAEKRGLITHPLLTQSQFLMGIGEKTQFADAFEECRLPQEKAKVALQLKHLVTPAGMGETFHVLVGARTEGNDTLTELGGLNFGKSPLLSQGGEGL